MIVSALCLASAHARVFLIAGLLAGMFLPTLAGALAPHLPTLVGMLLLVTALRIGHRAALGALADLRWGIGAVLMLQLAIPLAAFSVFSAFGVISTPAALAVVLTTAAPAISGSANLALLLGLDAGRMMQILVLGTAAFPLTVLPVLALVPQIGSAAQIIASAGLMLAVILLSTGAGFALRARLFAHPTARQTTAMDGASTLAFAIIVIALMAPLNATLRHAPAEAALWAALAFALGYGLQLTTLLVLRRTRLRPIAGPLAIGAGNRNVALFLVALPPEKIAPLLIFVACWQLPMYLTPVLLAPLYRKVLADD